MRIADFIDNAQIEHFTSISEAYAHASDLHDEDARLKSEAALREAEAKMAAEREAAAKAESEADKAKAEKAVSKAAKAVSKAEEAHERASIAPARREAAQAIVDAPTPRDQSKAAGDLISMSLDGGKPATKYSGDAPRSNEWYTPEHVLDAARRAMGGIDLDPASCAAANEHVQARRFFTLDDNALVQDWSANTIWLNPPYSDGHINEWVIKLIGTVDASKVGYACMLLHAATDTAYGQRAIACANAICFTRGRLKFEGPHADSKSGAQIGQMICYYGDAVHQFMKKFDHIGVCCYGGRQ